MPIMSVKIAEIQAEKDAYYDEIEHAQRAMLNRLFDGFRGISRLPSGQRCARCRRTPPRAANDSESSCIENYR
jgi:hypothetical protein